MRAAILFLLIGSCLAQTCQNGQAYQTGVLAKIIGSCPFDKELQAEKLEHKTWAEVTGKPATFWTYRYKWEYPPLRTKKQALKSKPLLIAHSAAAVAMIVACKRKGSGEDFGSEVPAVVGMAAIDYFASERYFGETFAIGPPIYQIQHYVRSALK